MDYKTRMLEAARQNNPVDILAPVASEWLIKLTDDAINAENGA